MHLWTTIMGVAANYIFLLVLLGACSAIAYKVKSAFACAILVFITYGIIGILCVLYLYWIGAEQNSTMTFYVMSAFPLFIAGRIHGKKFSSVAEKPQDAPIDE